MAESTLTFSYADIVAALADAIGWNAAAEATREARFIKEGLGQFYYPPPCPPDREAYSWRFLTPTLSLILWPDVAVGTATVTGVHAAGTTTLTATASSFYPSMVGREVVITATGTYTITGYTSATVILLSGDATCAVKTFSIASEGAFGLPDSFSGSEGPFAFAANAGGYQPITLINERQIADLRQRSTMVSRPRCAALRPRSFVATIGQRWDLVVYPTPETTYTVNYPGRIHPDTITSTLVQVMGGTPHSRTVKESILWVADRELNADRGGYERSFMTALRASIDFDRRHFGSSTVGMLYDPSSGLSRQSYHRSQDVLVTYQGVQYGPN